MGYALDSWDALSAAAVKDGYSQEVMEKAGLLSRKEERVYDRFRGRVIFPVHNLSGKVIAFGARMLSKEKQPNQPKYINSPETDIYHKSQVLFGMNLARNVIRQKENCYLVEGYMDVIAMHQAGIENVVASSGTALTEEQVKLIKRFSDNVTLLFDGDEAGIRAAIRGIDLLLSGGLNVKLVLLPDGHDPDSYSRSTGSAALQDYLRDNARDFISFIASLYAKDSAGDPIRKAESIREIVKSIAKVPDGIKRSVYTSETARLLEVPEPVLLTELNKIIIADRRARDREL
ncbi:MAG: DNA primase, partial [Bacteroidota bacterium]